MNLYLYQTEALRTARVMATPTLNLLPAQIGLGMIAYHADPSVTAEQLAPVQALLNASALGPIRDYPMSQPGTYPTDGKPAGSGEGDAGNNDKSEAPENAAEEA